MKKDSDIKWNEQAKKYFSAIKLALRKVVVLIRLNYSKEFLTFSFASKDTIVVVLFQDNFEGHEQPIAFFSRASRDAELKYNIMEKRAYALVKPLKSFRVYILHSKFIAYVSNIFVKDILMQPNNEGKWGKWIEKILEYDLEIRPT